MQMHACIQRAYITSRQDAVETPNNLRGRKGINRRPAAPAQGCHFLNRLFTYVHVELHMPSSLALVFAPHIGLVSFRVLAVPCLVSSALYYQYVQLDKTIARSLRWPVHMCLPPFKRLTGDIFVPRRPIFQRGIQEKVLVDGGKNITCIVLVRVD